MPGGDGTGPLGKGAFTGWGKGACSETATGFGRKYTIERGQRLRSQRKYFPGGRGGQRGRWFSVKETQEK